MTEQALVARENGGLTLSSSEVELVKKTVAAGATDDELRLFLHDCRRQGVHPLDKLIHFTKRGGRYTPITSIDFMRMRAADTGELAGNDEPEYTFAADEDVIPKTASVTVYRLVQGQRCPFKATARWAEYKPPSGQDHMWLKMPHLMLGKCAEALALRKAFPKQLHGIYERAEMAQAGREDSEGRSHGEAASGAGERTPERTRSGVVTQAATGNSSRSLREGGPDSDKVEAEITVPSEPDEADSLFPSPEDEARTNLLIELHQVITWLKGEKKAKNDDIIAWKKTYLKIGANDDANSAPTADLRELRGYLRNRFPTAPWKKDTVAL